MGHGPKRAELCDPETSADFWRGIPGSGLSGMVLAE
jgi:hypothetical protein